MSYFGQDTFKQAILDEIEWRAKDKGLSKPQAASEVAEVLSYLCGTAFSRDEEIERVRTEAKEQARKELIASLGKA